MINPQLKKANLEELHLDQGNLPENTDTSSSILVIYENGQPAFVMQPVSDYERLVEKAYKEEFIAAVKIGLKEIQDGQGVPLEIAFADLINKHGL